MAKEREIKIPLKEILDLVNCADTYGFNNSVLMSAFAEWVGDLSDADISKYAKWYTSREGKSEGYDAEDRYNAIERLVKWRHRFYPDHLTEFAKQNELTDEKEEVILDEMIGELEEK